MLYMRLYVNGARSPLVKFLTNETVDVQDKITYLLGACVYVNSITTLTTTYDEWLKVCSEYPLQTIGVKNIKSQRVNGQVLTTPVSINDHFRSDAPEDLCNWFYIKSAKDIPDLLHPQDSMSIASKLGLL